MESGAMLPPELMRQLLDESNLLNSCPRGFVLDGYPSTVGDLQALGVMPTHVLLFQVSDDIAADRQSGRSVDPVTGAIYHDTLNPPPPEIAARLVRRATDQDKAKIARRLAGWRASESELCKHLPASRVHAIDATPSPSAVWHSVRRCFETLAPHYRNRSWFVHGERPSNMSDWLTAHAHCDGHTIVDVERAVTNGGLHAKIAPIDALELGPQSADVMYRCLPNFAPFGHSSDQGFATVGFGVSRKADWIKSWERLLEQAAKPNSGIEMVEVEVNLFEEEWIITADGAKCEEWFAKPYFFEPEEWVIPHAPGPFNFAEEVGKSVLWELHHGIDITAEESAKLGANAPNSHFFAELATKSGLSWGGCFTMTKPGILAVRFNEFNGNPSYDEALALLKQQRERYLGAIRQYFPSLAFEYSCSIERVVAVVEVKH